MKNLYFQTKKSVLAKQKICITKKSVFCKDIFAIQNNYATEIIIF